MTFLPAIIALIMTLHSHCLILILILIQTIPQLKQQIITPSLLILLEMLTSYQINCCQSKGLFTEGMLCCVCYRFSDMEYNPGHHLDPHLQEPGLPRQSQGVVRVQALVRDLQAARAVAQVWVWVHAGVDFLHQVHSAEAGQAGHTAVFQASEVCHHQSGQSSGKAVAPSI